MVSNCAVQLAKQAGGYVFATASTKNVAAVRDLGADVVSALRSATSADYGLW